MERSEREKKTFWAVTPMSGHAAPSSPCCRQLVAGAARCLGPPVWGALQRVLCNLPHMVSGRLSPGVRRRCCAVVPVLFHEPACICLAQLTCMRAQPHCSRGLPLRACSC